MSVAVPPRSVLIVDDETDILEMVRLVLEDRGIEVDTAANGREGLDAIAAHMPDLVLLDMKMPVMDGVAFAAELRKRYQRLPPVIVLTATADPRQTALEIGAAGWIAKPFDLGELVTTVASHL